MPEEQRYRKEIEEILAKANNKPLPKKKKTKVRTWTATRKSASAGVSHGYKSFTTPTHLLILGMLILLASIFITEMLVFWLGLAILALAYVSFFKKRGRRYEKRWRGQPIDDSANESNPTRKWPWINKN